MTLMRKYCTPWARNLCEKKVLGKKQGRMNLLVQNDKYIDILRN